MATKKYGIDEFKDRMSSPVKIVRINPKTGKPIRAKKAAAKKK